MSKTRTNQPIYTDDLSGSLSFPQTTSTTGREVSVKELGGLCFVHLYFKSNGVITAGIAMATGLPKPKHNHTFWADSDQGLLHCKLNTNGVLSAFADVANNIYCDIEFFYEVD